MGPRNYGLGSQGRSRLASIVQAPPTSPESGSGGPGILSIPRALGNTGNGPALSLSPAIGEISEARTGRITLGMVNFTILVFLGFYYWTRSAQGGG